jgi:hypothetical protein
MTISLLSADILGEVSSKLSSGGRFNALTRFDEAGGNEWGMGVWLLGGIVALLVILGAMFVAVSVIRAMKEKKAAKLSVASKGRQMGLSERQLRMAGEIADRAGLPDRDGIYSIEDAFDRGVQKIIEQNLSKGLVREEIVRLKAELSGLREKIGFRDKVNSEPAGRPALSNQPTTRQISAGRVVRLTRRANPVDGGIETSIIENNKNEIRVKLVGNIKINFGDSWRVRYDYGASVWEFDSTVTGYDGNILRLSHSDNVRFISRRRFDSVVVKEQSLVANFPFSGPARPEGVGSPFFVPMTVTAIAGPWLRLETAHRIVSNQRVLVIMKIENAVAKPGQNGFETQVIEDTGEIKNIEQKGDNFIVSIELTGLSDSDIDHLVSVAKRVAVKSASQAAGKEGAGEAAEETKENYKAAGAGARQ